MDQNGVKKPNIDNQYPFPTTVGLRRRAQSAHILSILDLDASVSLVSLAQVCPSLADY